MKAHRKAGLYASYIRWIMLTYAGVQAFMQDADGMPRFMFNIFAGVIQGDPLAAAVFVIAFDPFLRRLDRILAPSIPRKPLVWACADDVAITLANFNDVVILNQEFGLLKAASGMQLNLLKCIFTILAQHAEEARIGMVEMIKQRIPDWTSIRLDTHGEYLGFHVGPTAKKLQWRGAFDKYITRATETAHSDMGSELSIVSYNSRILPVLSYIMQFAFIPEALLDKETPILVRMMKMPFNALTRDEILVIDKYIGLAPRSLMHTSMATLFRVMNSFPRWKLIHEELQQHLSNYCFGYNIDHDKLKHYNRSCSPPWWDTNPIVEVYQQAENGIYGNLTFSQSFNWYHFVNLAYEWTCNKALADSRSIPKPQKTAYQFLKLKQLHDTVPFRILLRGHSTFKLFDSVTEDTVNQFLLVFNRMPRTVRATVMRTITNGWCTATRMLDVTSTHCLFCWQGHHAYDGIDTCDEHVPLDRLQHYLVCPNLWNVFEDTVSKYLPWGSSYFAACGVGWKLNLRDPSHTNMHMLALLTTFYFETGRSAVNRRDEK